MKNPESAFERSPEPEPSNPDSLPDKNKSRRKMLLSCKVSQAAQQDATDKASSYPVQPKEEEGIARMLGYEILDTEDDPRLDRLTQLAAYLCDVPVAMISLVDRTRQWFKSVYGLPVQKIPREESFCAHAILDPEKIFIVPDATKDPRFASNPLVTESPFIRFYAGVPLVTKDHLTLGTFCVVDFTPKELNEHQLETLRRLSRIAMDLIEVHRSNTKLGRLLHLEKEVYSRLLRSSADLASATLSFDEALNFLMNHLDENLGWLSARVRNMQSGGTTGIFYNKSIPADPEIPLIWQRIDGTPRHMTEITSSVEFINAAPLRPEYSYLSVPVRVRNRLVALIELIYPDHRKVDTRIQEIFGLMASNLAIVAERELVMLELQYQATHDHLTGAANRSVIMKGIEQALKECDPVRPDSLVLFFDIDGFKEVNDNFGHETGDSLLIEITRRLDSVRRSNDLLGRLSGDEFILVAREIDVENGLAPLLERLQKTLSSSFMIGDLEIKVNSSIGCAVIAEPDLTVNELMRRAEEAMYLVKTGERRGFCVADEEMVKTLQCRRSLDRRVKEAFQNNRFFAVYQPIIDLDTGGIVGFEALMRLLERDGSVMPACEFMPTILRTRFLTQLDDYVLAETLRAFRSEDSREFLAAEHFRFSVNIGSAILSANGYAGNCLSQLEKSGISPKRLMLEITESYMLQPNEAVLRNLDILREKGVTIALDDFGTGYSNLQQLSTLPVDIIKIDKEFIQGIASGNLTKNSLLGAIIGIGKNLGYEIIAEGVEEKIQADYLKALGCHYAQGYYFGKPLPMSEWLESRKQGSAHLAPPSRSSLPTHLLTP